MDWSNVYLGAKNGFGVYIDPLLLRDLIGRGRNLTRVHYFCATNDQNPAQARFEGVLQRRGFIIHTQPLETREVKMKCRGCGTEFDASCPSCHKPAPLPPHKSKMVDIDIAKHLIILADEYDEAIIVSGDKDFLPVIQWLRTVKNKRVSIYSWSGSFSGMLINDVDAYEYLDRHLAEIKDARVR